MAGQEVERERGDLAARVEGLFVKTMPWPSSGSA